VEDTIRALKREDFEILASTEECTIVYHERVNIRQKESKTRKNKEAEVFNIILTKLSEE
jgi:hypothetical protein